jgi:hypothetical protein
VNTVRKQLCAGTLDAIFMILQPTVGTMLARRGTKAAIAAAAARRSARRAVRAGGHGDEFHQVQRGPDRDPDRRPVGGPRTAAEVALFERALDRSSKLLTRLAAIGLDSERIHYLRVREARTLGNWVADLMNRIFARTGSDWRPADVSAIVAEGIRAMPDPGRWW